MISLYKNDKTNVKNVVMTNKNTPSSAFLFNNFWTSVKWRFHLFKVWINSHTAGKLVHVSGLQQEQESKCAVMQKL